MRGLPAFERRKRDAHKGDFGRVLVVAGSWGMAGAAALAARAAYRAGAGVVHLAIPDAVYPSLATLVPEAVFLPLPGRRLSSRHRKAILFLSERCQAAAVGCGLGLDRGTIDLVQALIEEVRIPLVLDADGLNAAAESPGSLRRRRHPLVLTPHEGEMARLLRMETVGVRKRRREVAERAARALRAVVVLKGHETIVTDGLRTFVNPTGNPGMATAGTGDVLCGVIAGLIGQGFSPWDAARLGVFVHGRAGDLAAAALGETSMVAGDLLEFLPRAIQERTIR